MAVPRHQEDEQPRLLQQAAVRQRKEPGNLRLHSGAVGRGLLSRGTSELCPPRGLIGVRRESTDIAASVIKPSLSAPPLSSSQYDGAFSCCQYVMRLGIDRRNWRPWPSRRLHVTNKLPHAKYRARRTCGRCVLNPSRQVLEILICHTGPCRCGHSPHLSSPEEYSGGLPDQAEGGAERRPPLAAVVEEYGRLLTVNYDHHLAEWQAASQHIRIMLREALSQVGDTK